MKRIYARLLSALPHGEGLGVVFFLALLTLAGCDKQDNPAAGPATQQQLDALDGHWYAELPISGETDNWMTEDDPDDKAAYDRIGAVITFNNEITEWSYWSFFYLNGTELVNVHGVSRLTEEAVFDFTMDSNGYITPTAHLEDAPKVSNMRFWGDRITASVTYMGRTLDITFREPDDAQTEMLEDIWEILVEREAVIGGDTDYKVETGISDDDASTPSRSRQQ